MPNEMEATRDNTTPTEQTSPKTIKDNVIDG